MLRSPSRLARPPVARAARLALALLVLSGAAPALAGPVNKSLFGVAIEGVDPVAYFRESRPVAGSKQHELQWMGATWRFASEENRAAFQAEPERYAPQYGGFCAYAVSQGGKAGIDPEAWRIVDGRLYLNFDAKIQERWEKDRDRYISLADENWVELSKE